MLRRLSLASRRATAAQTSLHLPSRQRQVMIQSARHFSFLPWKRKQPSMSLLPVYFPRTNSSSRWRRWKISLGWAVFSAVIYFLCFNAFLNVVVQLIIDWSDEEWEALSEAEKKEIEKEESEGATYFFLPMPFSTVKVMQPLYRGSSAEWQLFLKISKNGELQDAVKADLLAIMLKTVSENKEYVKFLGGENIKVGRLWLDITFPVRPPAKHYIRGLAFCSDGIYWTLLPIESSIARSLDETIYPKAVALAFWTFWKSLLKQNAQYIYNSFAANEPSTSHLITSAPTNHPGIKSNASNQPISSSPSTSTSSSSSLSSSDYPSSNVAPSQMKRILMTNPEKINESIIDNDIDTALHDAFKTFASEWRQAPSPHNPGSFFVDGVVEFFGPGAAVALYVWAWYDPKLKGWTSINVVLKHRRPHVQSPAE